MICGIFEVVSTLSLLNSEEALEHKVRSSVLLCAVRLRVRLNPGVLWMDATVKGILDLHLKHRHMISNATGLFSPHRGACHHCPRWPSLCRTISQISLTTTRKRKRLSHMDINLII